MPRSHFTAKDVYKLTSEIPEGKVSTYGAVANALKAPGASRAVGQILKANPTPIVVPCHRVVKSDGGIGGYGGASGSNKKIKLLRSEGLEIRNGKVLNLENVVFTRFSSTVSYIQSVGHERNGISPQIRFRIWHAGDFQKI